MDRAGFLKGSLHRQRVRWLACLILPALGLSQPTPEWRKSHSFSNRYEGLVTLNTGDVDFEVLNFTVAPFPQIHGAVDLWVRFYCPQDMAATVFAHEIEVSQQYWMESREINLSAGARQEFGPWPTGDVILKEKVQPSNIAVVVRPQNLQLVDYLPAVIAQDRAAQPIIVDKYVLFLRSRHNLRTLTYEVQSAKPGAAAKVEAKTIDVPNLSGIPFQLPLDARKMADGPVRLILQGTVGSTKLQPVTIRFYHQRKL